MNKTFQGDEEKNLGVLRDETGNIKLSTAHTELYEAAHKVLAGLNARIDDAGDRCQPVPLFDGIGELHSALLATASERKKVE